MSTIVLHTFVRNNITTMITVGTLGADISCMADIADCPISSRLSLIAGTSTCHMAVSVYFTSLPMP